jgi:hypothetical protein
MGFPQENPTGPLPQRRGILAKASKIEIRINKGRVFF